MGFPFSDEGVEAERLNGSTKARLRVLVLKLALFISTTHVLSAHARESHYVTPLADSLVPCSQAILIPSGHSMGPA